MNIAQKVYSEKCSDKQLELCKLIAVSVRETAEQYWYDFEDGSTLIFLKNCSAHY